MLYWLNEDILKKKNRWHTAVLVNVFERIG